jgi:hypothetical protein
MTNIQEPLCIQCKSIFSKEFLEQSLSPYFLQTEYKKSREQLLLERELSMIPKTLEMVELNREQVQMCNDELNHLLQEKYKLISQLSEIKSKITIYKQNIHKLETNKTLVIDTLNIQKTQNSYIKKCIHQNCRGFINHKGYCILCNCIVCLECFELKLNDFHQCNPSIIQSIQLIKNETKPCPKCNISIYKIEGCNQMWCTYCHTTFDWKSLKMIYHTIHNPHYYEYITSNTNNTKHITNDESSFLFKLQKLDTNDYSKQKILNIYRRMQHLRYEELPQYVTENDLFLLHLNLRYRYIKNYISENKFKQVLIQKEIGNDKKKHFYSIFEKTIESLTSLLYDLIQFQNFETFWNQYDSLLNDSNQQLKSICKKYKHKIYYFDHNFNLIK